MQSKHFVIIYHNKQNEKERKREKRKKRQRERESKVKEQTKKKGSVRREKISALSDEVHDCKESA